MKNVNKLNDDNFKEMNSLIVGYNKKLVTYQSEPGGRAFSIYKFVIKSIATPSPRSANGRRVCADQRGSRRPPISSKPNSRRSPTSAKILLAEGKQLQADEDGFQSKKKNACRPRPQAASICRLPH